MTIIALQFKANMLNVTDLQPSNHKNFRWYLKLKCTNCGEQPEHWQYVVEEEKTEILNSRGLAHLNEKCKLCGRQNSLEIVDKSFCAYNMSEEFQNIIKFDCRGLEPVDFDLRSGWKAVGTETGTVFDDIDLSETEWVDYDEKIAEPTEINEISVRFVSCKK